MKWVVYGSSDDKTWYYAEHDIYIDAWKDFRRVRAEIMLQMPAERRQLSLWFCGAGGDEILDYVGYSYLEELGKIEASIDGVSG